MATVTAILKSDYGVIPQPTKLQVSVRMPVGVVKSDVPRPVIKTAGTLRVMTMLIGYIYGKDSRASASGPAQTWS